MLKILAARRDGLDIDLHFSAEGGAQCCNPQFRPLHKGHNHRLGGALLITINTCGTPTEPNYKGPFDLQVSINIIWRNKVQSSIISNIHGHEPMG